MTVPFGLVMTLGKLDGIVVGAELGVSPGARLVLG
jgi:hypothetical protein